jgi:hypothetical protein
LRGCKKFLVDCLNTVARCAFLKCEPDTRQDGQSEQYRQRNDDRVGRHFVIILGSICVSGRGQTGGEMSFLAEPVKHIPATLAGCHDSP